MPSLGPFLCEESSSEYSAPQTHPRPTFSLLLRKEVIQPQVPLRLPCYDFTPITDHTLGTYLPEGLAQ